MNLLHQPGEEIAGRYRTIALLGRGAFGTTYEAEDLETHQSVALKVLSLRQLNDWKALELFEREAKVLAALSHSAIPNYLDHFHLDAEDGDRLFYLVQELAPGRSLATLIEGGWHASEAEVKQMARQILDVLRYLHSLAPPVIHRDIKPQNILRTDEGKIYLVDFGAVQAVYRNTLSFSGTFVGTFGYMSPEQFSGQVKPASDLYALGATLAYVLTHRSPTELPHRRLKIDFRSSATVSETFGEWLDRLLEPTLEERFSTADDALESLFSEGKRTENLPDRGRPLGSQILLKRTPGRIAVEIPASQGYWPVLLVGVACAAFLHGIALFFLGILAVTNGRAWLRYFAHISIEIERQAFLIQWRLLGFNVTSIGGRTEDLQRVDLEKVGNDAIACVLFEGIRKHHFGSRLTLSEQTWLMRELSDFVDRVRADRRP